MSERKRGTMIRGATASSSPNSTTTTTGRQGGGIEIDSVRDVVLVDSGGAFKGFEGVGFVTVLCKWVSIYAKASDGHQKDSVLEQVWDELKASECRFMNYKVDQRRGGEGKLFHVTDEDAIMAKIKKSLQAMMKDRQQGARSSRTSINSRRKKWTLKTGVAATAMAAARRQSLESLPTLARPVSGSPFHPNGTGAVSAFTPPPFSSATSVAIAAKAMPSIVPPCVSLQKAAPTVSDSSANTGGATEEVEASSNSTKNEENAEEEEAVVPPILSTCESTFTTSSVIKKTTVTTSLLRQPSHCGSTTTFDKMLQVPMPSLATFNSLMWAKQLVAEEGPPSDAVGAGSQRSAARAGTTSNRKRSDSVGADAKSSSKVVNADTKATATAATAADPPSVARAAPTKQGKRQGNNKTGPPKVLRIPKIVGIPKMKASEPGANMYDDFSVDSDFFPINGADQDPVTNPDGTVVKVQYHVLRKRITDLVRSNQALLERVKALQAEDSSDDSSPEDDAAEEAEAKTKAAAEEAAETEKPAKKRRKKSASNDY